MSMVAPLPGQAPEKNVATLALTAFTAFLIGPPFIGITAGFVGLPVALALLAPLGAAPLLLRPRPQAGDPRGQRVAQPQNTRATRSSSPISTLSRSARKSIVTAWPGKITRLGSGSVAGSSVPTEVPTRLCSAAAPQASSPSATAPARRARAACRRRGPRGSAPRRAP